MTQPEMLRLLRTLSAVETAMLCKGTNWPEHLFDDLSWFMELIQREILGNGNQDPTL